MLRELRELNLEDLYPSEVTLNNVVIGLPDDKYIYTVKTRDKGKRRKNDMRVRRCLQKIRSTNLNVRSDIIAANLLENTGTWYKFKYPY